MAVNGKSYLLPINAGRSADSFLPLQEAIYEPLNSRTMLYKLVVIDACRNDPKKGPPPNVPGGTLKGRGNSEVVDGIVGGKAFQLETPPKGIYVMASCDDDQFSWEDDSLHHGVFMNFIIKGIAEGKAVQSRDGYLKAYDLYQYAVNQTMNHMNNRGANNNPDLVQVPRAKGDVNQYPVFGRPGIVGNTEFAGLDLTQGSSNHDRFMREIAQSHNLDLFDLRKSNLSGLDLSGFSMKKIWLEDATLRGTTLNKVNLTGAHCQRAIFEEARLRSAILSGDFRNCNFRSADLTHADRRGLFQGADFTGASGIP